MIQTAAVVPVKQLSMAKQRLSTLLNEQERGDLFLAMLQDVLSILTKCQRIDRIYIITSDPTFSALAKEYNAEIIFENQPGGLNQAVTLAGKKLVKDGFSRMVFVPGDLPLLSTEELDKVLSFNIKPSLFSKHPKNLSKNSITIVPSTNFNGSNCIVCTPPDCLPFSFGEQSYARHLKIAEDLNLDIQILHLSGIGLDIDSGKDLKLLADKLVQAKNTDTYTYQYLKNNALFDQLLKKQKVFFTPTEADTFNYAEAWPKPDKTMSDESKLDDNEALALADEENTENLMLIASDLRDRGHGQVISFSKKIFIPLTHLCRDVCHYCTFAQVPGKLKSPYLEPNKIITLARQGVRSGCKEALFTLGDNPEARYPAARKWLDDNGYNSTLDYLEDIALRVSNETGLMPHLNPGLMSYEELARLKKVSISMGIMLESSSDRLTEKGMPHYGSPDKLPARRIETIRLAGEQGIPFTSGILIGIGETRLERIESLLVLRNLHRQYGHIQEIIIQNFRAKSGTKMANVAEPDLNELLWTLSVARIIFGPEMNIQAPPNLSPDALPQIINAGINDWGGVSPLTPDFVNPEAPWPHLDTLTEETRVSGKHLVERLAIYPEFALEANQWTTPEFSKAIFASIDGSGFVHNESWSAGLLTPPPSKIVNLIKSIPSATVSKPLKKVFDKLASKDELNENDIVSLLSARGSDFTHVCHAANEVRKTINGNQVTYVINRNINYTNICYFDCKFCAFSKGKTHENLREKPYNINTDEIVVRAKEAWSRGATEVCLQGGIHPEYTGLTYLDICHAIKEAVPELHIHAFSPLEITQGANTLGLSISIYLEQLKQAGLSTLPGTAAEILDDEIRSSICPDKIDTQQWLKVMETAHNLGIKTTATIMFGHMEKYQHIARHLMHIRQLQKRTNGFTEFVPLPFVHMETPIYRKGKARKGPSFREAILIHAVSRLVLHPYIKNIQASWPKLGRAGVLASLNAGVNDLGGTLINESITRAAGASHGQELSPGEINDLIMSAGRIPQQRTTRYNLLDNNAKQQLFFYSDPDINSSREDQQIQLNQINTV